jgi:hypothetical protein
MGYVQNHFPKRAAVGAQDGLTWESLGQLVQSQTLDAVALHFFEAGVAQLCMEAMGDDKFERALSRPSIARNQGRMEHEI